MLSQVKLKAKLSGVHYYIENSFENLEFNRARGHDMERENYLTDLQSGKR